MDAPTPQNHPITTFRLNYPPTKNLFFSLIKQEITGTPHQKPQTIPFFPISPPATLPFQTFSNKIPDRAPGKTGNNRKIKLENLNSSHPPTSIQAFAALGEAPTHHRLGLTPHRHWGEGGGGAGFR
jgi:hypothetical protein